MAEPAGAHHVSDVHVGNGMEMEFDSRELARVYNDGSGRRRRRGRP